VALWGLSGSFWELSGSFRELLGAVWELLGVLWDLLGALWELLAAFWELLGALWELLGALWEFLWALGAQIAGSGRSAPVFLSRPELWMLCAGSANNYGRKLCRTPQIGLVPVRARRESLKKPVYYC